MHEPHQGYFQAGSLGYTDYDKVRSGSRSCIIIFEFIVISNGYDWCSVYHLFFGIVDPLVLYPLFGKPGFAH